MLKSRGEEGGWGSRSVKWGTCSSSWLPVLILNTLLRRSLTSNAVRNPNVLIFWQASLILSTLASENPLMAASFLRVVMCIPLMVQIPAAFSFLMSATLIPCCCSPSTSRNGASSSSTSVARHSILTFTKRETQNAKCHFPVPAFELWHKRLIIYDHYLRFIPIYIIRNP